MLYIAADHAGYQLKEELKPFLENRGRKVIDLGAKEFNLIDDYPNFATRLAKRVAKEKDAKGILICGTGQGMCLAANKFPGIRAALIYNEFTARAAAEHVSANVICLGGRTTAVTTAKKLVKIWLETRADKDQRHERRLKKIAELENN